LSGEHLDLSSEERPATAVDDPRPFVGIHFACCDAYARVYRNREATAYVGHCPRCLKRVELKVAPGGTDARFFTAY
jgi:hypothetical protein